AVEHQPFSIDHFERHLVNVHRMRVGSEVEELPHFGRAQLWILAHFIDPHHRHCVPSSSTLPSIASIGPSKPISGITSPFSTSASRRVDVSAGRAVIGGSVKNRGGVVVSTLSAGRTRNS